ncbi:VWA domain-containing protein [Mycobacterium manitobense]|uniref:VWA domain-containing protein n=1 Tax=[Mycobacterium] manitobense TaxID=190147 RepID=A0A9X2YGK3_9MYCO|nr:VWA domain-containing protein [[Mycobacterium] manitobense]MCV7174067.1 VWA domain-containing protein [[Mycobacterium] manitobense]
MVDLGKGHASIAGDTREFDLLASALSGRTVRIVAGPPGEPAWTDGTTIYPDAAATAREQIMSVVIQASLISAGSLTPLVLRSLKRRTGAVNRYLALEGHRALTVNRALLPPWIPTVIDPSMADRTDSPDDSLRIALSREPVRDPPAVFGALRIKPVLAAEAAQATDHQGHAPSRKHGEVQELDDHRVDDDNATAAVDMFSVGGTSGVLGRLLKRFLKSSHRGDASGAPGSDTPTHLSRRNDHRRGTSVLSTASSASLDAATTSGGLRYPEWDTNRKSYRQDWCTVREIDPSRTESHEPRVLDDPRLRRTLARLNLGLDQHRRQPSGDDIDLDAVIDLQIQRRTSSGVDENVYVDSLRRRRDLSVLVLLDISGSAAESDGSGRTVHERQRAAAAAITAALHDLGDRVALYAYNSQGRSAVQMFPLKRFDDHFDSGALRRLYALEPGAYSRLGAAIRHGAAVLETRGGTSRKLLVVLSDGLAYDHGYDRHYGAADARRALAEIRVRGAGGLCLTFGANTDAESLRRVFGTAAHATVADESQLAHAVGALVRSALRSAEVRRRTS